MSETAQRLVLDASVLIARQEVGDPHHDAARALFSGTRWLATTDLAYYETTNVAIRSWHNPGAAERLSRAVAAIQFGDRLIRVDQDLISMAIDLAERHGITVYDASYVAAAARVGAQLVSCDVRDLVSRGLAVLPADALR